MNKDRGKLIDTAVGINENYRCGDDLILEIGFLYGTAELITALTLMPDESYSDVREQIAREIDRQAGESTYPVLKNME